MPSAFCVYQFNTYSFIISTPRNPGALLWSLYRHLRLLFELRSGRFNNGARRRKIRRGQKLDTQQHDDG